MLTVGWILLASGVACVALNFVDELLTDITITRRNQWKLVVDWHEKLRDVPFMFMLGVLILPTVYMAIKLCQKTARWSWTGRWPTV